MLTNSAVESAPAKLMRPAKTQQKTTQSDDPNASDMGAIFLKTPEPIITLITKKIAERSPIFGFNVSMLDQIYPQTRFVQHMQETISKLKSPGKNILRQIKAPI